MDNLDNMVISYDNDNHPQLQKADVAMRITAFIIDDFFITPILITPFMLLIFEDIQNAPDKMLSMFPMFMLAGFLVYCLKDIVNGASPGKRMLGLAVRNSANPSETPSVFKLIVRNIFTFIWPVELLVLACGAKNTKLGDKIAGTDVYHVPKKPKILLIIVSVILFVAIFVTSLLFLVSNIIKNDDSYKAAVQYIETNSEITDLAGNIEGYGFTPVGSLNTSGGYGQAGYLITVKGDQNTVYVDIGLEKSPETDWEITYCYHKA